VDQDVLIGTWDLTALEIRPDGGGELTYVLGEHPKGRLTYGSDGQVVVFLAAADRPAINWRMGEVAAELKAEAYDSFVSYRGAWELLGEKMVHHVEFSSVPAYVGTDLVRDISFEGEKLVLSLTLLIDGISYAIRLVWNRD
jgi:hypothetical protein